MDSHLVTVEVGVERCTDKRMKLNSLTLDKDRLKCLDTESVKSRRTVQHDRMLCDYILKDIPDFAFKAFDHLLGALNIVCCSAADKLLHDKRLKELDRHLLRKTALVNLKFRTDDDNGTAGIVDTLAEQVLTETSGLAFQHV